MGHYGALAALAGTALSTVVAMVIAVPLALVIALLLVELAHPTVRQGRGDGHRDARRHPEHHLRHGGPLRRRARSCRTGRPLARRSPLGKIPGIKPGPTFQGGGMSMLTAGIVLAFMVLPYITAVSRDVLRMVPQVTKEAGYGMGSTTWEVLRKISMRYANSGIVGAVLHRARPRPRRDDGRHVHHRQRLHVGAQSLLDPGTTIASLIANTFNEATDPLQRRCLIELGLILFVITLVFQILAQALAAARAARPEAGHESIAQHAPCAAPPAPLHARARAGGPRRQGLSPGSRRWSESP